jgi:hypothetical protein
MTLRTQGPGTNLDAELQKQAAPARGPESAGFDHASAQRRTT